MISLLVTAALGAECTVEELRVQMAQIRTGFVDPGEGKAPSTLVRDEAPDIARQAECLGDAVPEDLAAEVHMLLAIQAQLDLRPEVRDENRCAIGAERVNIAVGWGLASADWVSAPCPEAPVPVPLPDPVPVQTEKDRLLPRPVGFAGIAAGALALGGGSLLLVQTGRAAGSWKGTLSEEEQSSWNRQLTPYRAGSVGLMVGGAALAGTGVYFAF